MKPTEGTIEQDSKWSRIAHARVGARGTLVLVNAQKIRSDLSTQEKQMTA
jgi:hypothetical protein